MSTTILVIAAIQLLITAAVLKAHNKHWDWQVDQKRYLDERLLGLREGETRIGAHIDYLAYSMLQAEKDNAVGQRILKDDMRLYYTIILKHIELCTGYKTHVVEAEFDGIVDDTVLERDPDSEVCSQCGWPMDSTPPGMNCTEGHADSTEDAPSWSDYEDPSEEFLNG